MLDADPICHLVLDPKPSILIRSAVIGRICGDARASCWGEGEAGIGDAAGGGWYGGDVAVVAAGVGFELGEWVVEAGVE
jgi:hypothetical protein